MNPDNILIAKFMGWQVKHYKSGPYFNFFKPGAKNPCSVLSRTGCLNELVAWSVIAEKAKYHKSWDLLMPVVIKIRDLKLMDSGGFILELANVNLSLSRLDINDLYDSVVKFIKWYNKNNKV